MIEYLYIIPAALIAIVLHELGHALVSVWLGDPTPKFEGRLTLNPIKHIDPIGIICLIIMGFGWAKPVRIDPTYYKNKKIGMTLVGLAGPLMNFIVAIFSFIMIGIMIYIDSFFANTIVYIVNKFFTYLAFINIGLGLFNLIPIPPLDGSKIIGVVLPQRAYEEYMRYQNYGIYFMIGFMLLILILQNFGFDSPVSVVIDSVFNFFFEITEKIVLKIIN